MTHVFTGGNSQHSRGYGIAPRWLQGAGISAPRAVEVMLDVRRTARWDMPETTPVDFFIWGSR